MSLTQIAKLLNCYVAGSKKNNLTIQQYSSIKPQRGFTLIELIVVFSVMSVLSVLGIAGFNNYNQAQKLQNAAIDVVNTLNLAKSRALSQVKPSACGANALEDYRVDILNAQEYQLIAYCGSPEIIYVKKIPDPINFQVACSGKYHSFLFPVLTGGVVENSGCIPTLAPPWQIELISGTISKVIIIDELGGVRIQ